MPGYPQIKADYTHQVVGLKNIHSWTHLNTVSRVHPDDVAYAFGGRAAHLRTDGLFGLGASGLEMPVFLSRSQDAFDVATDEHNSYGVAVMPTGHVGAYVATGASELETTEFDQTKTWYSQDGVYSPSSAKISGADKSAAGLLFKTKNWPGGSDAVAVPGVDKLIGVASWGRSGTTIGPTVDGPVAIHPQRMPVLAFWPVYHPAAS